MNKIWEVLLCYGIKTLSGVGRAMGEGLRQRSRGHLASSAAEVLLEAQDGSRPSASSRVTEIGRATMRLEELSAASPSLPSEDVDVTAEPEASVFDAAEPWLCPLPPMLTVSVDRDYARLCARIPLLSAVQERKLGRQVQKGLQAQSKLAAATRRIPNESDLRGQVADGMHAGRHLAEANAHLVVTMSRRRWYRHRGLELADLIQEGNFGLLCAVERFNPEGGWRFSTFAAVRIHEALNRGLQKFGRLVSIPIRKEEAASRIRSARAQIEEFQNVSTVLDVAKELDMDPEAVRKIEKLTQPPLSFEEEWPAAEEQRWESGLSVGAVDVETMVFERFDRERLWRTLEEAIASIAPDQTQAERLWMIVNTRLVMPKNERLTCKQLAEIFGVTSERVRQMEHKLRCRLLYDETFRELWNEP